MTLEPVVSLLAKATLLLVVMLLIDALFRRRWVLATSAMWNTTHAALLVLPLALLLAPRWELPVLPPQTLPSPAPAVAVVVTYPPSIDRADVVATDRVPSPSAEQAPSDEQPLNARPAVSAGAEPLSTRLGVSPSRVVLGLYFVGLAVALLRLAASWQAVRRLRGTASVVVESAWQAPFALWQQRLGLSPVGNSVRLLQSDQVDVPLALGIRWPAIVIPARMIAERRAATLDAVLVHELAHVVRGDAAWQLVERLVQAALWFHPLAWLARRRITFLRERACDDFAVFATGDGDGYARTLLEIAARLSAQRSLGLSLAVVRPGHLAQRLSAIHTSVGNSRCQVTRAARLGLAAVALFGTLLLASVVVARAAAEEEPTPPAEQPAPDESKPAPSNMRRAEKQAANQWTAWLKAEQYDQAASRLDVRLRDNLPADKFKGLFEDLTTRYGRLKSGRREGRERFGDESLYVLSLEWERARLEVRLGLDEQQWITGLWIAPDPNHAPPDDFREADFRFGAVIHNAARADLSLTAKIEGIGGQPLAKSDSTFYREVLPDERPGPQDWDDSATGKSWRSIKSTATGGLMTLDHLHPGLYRVTANAGHDNSTPFGISDPIALDGTQKKTTSTVRLLDGPSLLVSAVDATTGLPVPRAQVTLQRADDHFPPGWSARPISPFKLDDQERIVTFDHLPPGPYLLWAYRDANYPDQVIYRIADDTIPVKAAQKFAGKPVLITIEPGRNQQVELKLQAVRLSEQEIANTWPWIVIGLVLDGQGQPVAGAEVHAHCGYGTLKQTGSATTGADGRYTLRFRAAGITFNPRLTQQVALISASKPGLVELNLSRQGNRVMAWSAPPVGNPDARNNALLPDQPQEINFQLVPAATIDVMIVDGAGRPIAEHNLSLTGDELPPGSNVLASETTKSDGHVFFSGVHAERFWRLSTRVGKQGEIQTMPFKLPSPGDFRLRVELRHNDYTNLSQLEIESITDPLGQEIKPPAAGD